MQLRRDHYNVLDWTILTDGYRVWISKQKIGKPPTDKIEIPKRIFDRLLACYCKKAPVGQWRAEKFKPYARQRKKSR